MKKIRNTDEALKLFEDAAIKQGDATKKGNGKVANNNYNKIIEIAKYLRVNKLLHELSIFYTHPNTSVRAWAAAFLLPLYEKKSIIVLQDIANMDIFESLDAEMTIKEWKNGNLRNFYTL